MTRGRVRVPEGAPPAIRLDKWLWFARFQRARADCAELVRAGHVRIGGRRVTQPGAVVRVGDVLTLALPGETILVEIRALAERRGESAAALRLYRRIEAGGDG
ncbi:S4 domain-containing protein [Rhabdaerophilum calidifontis]|uniref:S4 domain-containing protein n=1 Tax=Rhabdaerophilum calidifontis TaxID=2604328 RepID=UPI0012395D43|nr:S4 domain-containing protein [Rhabdaerophilum calidifontis]